VRVSSTQGNEAEFVGPSNAMFRISDTIRRTETADGGILLDVHHGQMFCLNIVGAKILELMQWGYDESRIADEISRSYGVRKEVVRIDVHDFIEHLQKHHILQPIRSVDVV
jgi:coenzyme PQQ synthesis protein D (PqqD)